MKSLVAALRTLVLPFGATTGRRIVLDGTNGLIAIYDGNNVLRLRLGSASDNIEMFSGQASESLAANLQAYPLGSAGVGTRRIGLIYESGSFAGRTKAVIDLNSESFDGTVDELINYIAESHNFSAAVTNTQVGIAGTLDVAGVASPDILIESRSIPRGVLELDSGTANVGPTVAATALTLRTVTATLKANRRYRLHGHVRSFAFTIDTDAFALQFREGATVLNEISLAPNVQAGVATAAADKEGKEIIHYIDGTTAASHTYTLTLIRLVGTGTSTAEAGATFPMQLVLEDVGPNTNL